MGGGRGSRLSRMAFKHVAGALPAAGSQVRQLPSMVVINQTGQAEMHSREFPTHCSSISKFGEPGPHQMSASLSASLTTRLSLHHEY